MKKTAVETVQMFLEWWDKKADDDIVGGKENGSIMQVCVLQRFCNDRMEDQFDFTHLLSIMNLHDRHIAKQYTGRSYVLLQKGEFQPIIQEELDRIRAIK